MKKNLDEWTVSKLYAAANEFCLKHWGTEYTGEIHTPKTRWKKTGGKYTYEIMGQPCQIILIDLRIRDEVLDCLHHELVHWRLHTTGKPFDDTDKEFIRECLLVGAPISNNHKVRNVAKTVAEEIWNTKIGTAEDSAQIVLFQSV